MTDGDHSDDETSRRTVLGAGLGGLLLQSDGLFGDDDGDGGDGFWSRLFGSGSSGGDGSGDGRSSFRSTVVPGIQLVDQDTKPEAPGQIGRVGADTLVYSGGQARNLTNVGGGGGGPTNVASGSTTLSSGSGVVDTGISESGATFQLAIGVDDPNADVKVAGRLFWDDSAGTYKIEFVESTSVGNPTVNYDVLRVR